jgi:hypothetical protein
MEGTLMLSESDSLEFQEFLRRAGIPVPPDELPALQEQFLLVKRHISIVDSAATDLGDLEPGFRFEAKWGEPA